MVKVKSKVKAKPKAESVKINKVKSKSKIKEKKIEKKKKLKKENDEGGMSLDDAFGDDDGVEYGVSKPRKIRKKDEDDEDGMSEDEISSEIDSVENTINSLQSDSAEKNVSIKASKDISKLKKGDKLKIDGKEYEVDAHYVMIDHGSTKEMAIELFDKNDKDYQLRYFDDQVETTIDFYELQEIIYMKRRFDKIEW